MNMKRKLPIAWLIVLSLILPMGLSACSPKTTPTVTSAAYKNPTPEAVVYSEVYGYVPVNQLVLVFEDSVDKAAAKKTIKKIGGTVVGEMEIINLYQLETNFTTEAELTAAIESALEMAGVEAAFPNVRVYSKDVDGVPCTPLKDPVFEDTDNASHYNTIGMENAWHIIKGSGVELKKVNVGVLDDAIYTGSDEFKGKVKVTGDTTEDPEKDNSGEIVDGGLSHGTMVTHVIGADPENNGMVGIAGGLGDNLNINVKNLFDDREDFESATPDTDDITQGVKIIGGVEYTYTIKALAYLKEQVDNGATVINCSFGPKEARDSHDWISKAYEKFFKKIQETKPGVVFVAAAGNEGEADKRKGALNGKNYFPAGLKLPNVITVGAIENDGSRADFSNFATEDAEVTLSAPGVEMVLGVDADGKPIKGSGTSFAAPQVTATIALIQSINPKLTAVDIKELLKETAAPGVTTYAESGKDGLIGESIPIPEGMGAGVRRVDVAVLKVINDLRIAAGEEPYTFNELFNNTFVSLRAAGGPHNYVITAGIPSAIEGRTDITLAISGGQYAIKGSSTQNVAAGGEASWELTLDKEPVFIRAIRRDNGGCATLSLDPTPPELEPFDLTGSWSGTAVLVGGDEVEDIEVEQSLSFSMVFNDDNEGTAYLEGGSVGISVSNDGSQVSFSASQSASIYGIVITSNASFKGRLTAEGVMVGTMIFTLTGQDGSATYYYDWSAQQ